MARALSHHDGGQGIAIQELDALDEADAQRQAIARGLRVLAIRAARWRGARRARLPLVAFSNELIALLEAGLSLVEAIDALTEKERDESVRHLLEGLRRRLYEGQSLSVARLSRVARHLPRPRHRRAHRALPVPRLRAAPVTAPGERNAVR